MAIDFPDNPSVNDTFTAGGKVYQWDGTVWEIYGPNVSPGTFKIDDVNNRVGIGTATPEYALHVDGDVGFNDAATANFFVSSGTGADVLPSGTTAQRPANPMSGMIRYNSETGLIEAFHDTSWVQLSNLFTATGGNEIAFYTENNTDYKAHIFTSSGTFSVTGGSGEVEALVIGGGGGGGPGGSGGGTGGGGGGGAGGVVEISSFVVSAGSYSVVVGSGGVGGSSNTSGGSSSALGFTAVGGGRGGRSDYGAGVSGGSGGGGAGGDGTSSASGGSGTSGQGSAGGTGRYRAGAGGGGFSEIGETPAAVTSTTAGAGGDGLTSTIRGNSEQFAGGGGAGNGNGAGGAGGAGGGGQGSDDMQDNWENGATNTGGGGGGGTDSGTRTSGFGGSGIVIIRYKI